MSHISNEITNAVTDEVKTVKLRIRILNIVEILAINLIIIFSLGFQIFLHNAPCSLCLLQRIGFFGIIVGLLMNLRFGLHPRHYSVILLSSFFTSLVALRQVAINTVPDGGYGDTFLGIHLYTWSFFISTAILIFTAIVLGFNRQFQKLPFKMKSPIRTHTLLAVTTIIFALNLILLLWECGFGSCHS